MSTHSLIGVQNHNGTVRFIYCHYDGYVEGVGADLLNRDRDLANELVDGGDLRCIGEPLPDGEGPRLADDIDDFAEMIGRCGCDYGYVLTKRGVWKYASYHDKVFHSLKQAVKNLQRD